MNLCYTSLKLLLGTYLSLFPQACRAFAADRIPGGAKIIAANHPNVTDTFHLAWFFNDQLHTLLMGELFNYPAFGWLLVKGGQIPVIPGQKEAALRRACDTLVTGGTVLIYPEARLNPENRPLKGKAGAVKMSLVSGAPIIPLGIYVPTNCTHNLRLQSKERLRQGRWQTSGICTLYFGEAWFPSQQIQGAVDTTQIFALTDQLMGRIYDCAQKASQEAEKSTATKARTLPARA